MKKEKIVFSVSLYDFIAIFKQIKLHWALMVLLVLPGICVAESAEANASSSENVASDSDSNFAVLDQGVAIDRVTFLVKDMDRAKERFQRIFNVEIAEGTEPGGDGEDGIKLIDQGVRAAASVPNAKIELISVVDVEKFKQTAESNALVKELNNEMLALVEQGYEGPVSLWLKVGDCKNAAEAVKAKGVRVAVYREGGHPGLVPRFQEAFLNWEDLPVSGINLVSREAQ